MQLLVKVSRGEVGLLEFLGKRQPHFKIGAGAELDGGFVNDVVQYVPAGATRGVDKVNVAAWHRDSLFKHWGAETTDDALDVFKVQLLIAAHRLRHGRVGLGLFDHGARAH